MTCSARGPLWLLGGDQAILGHHPGGRWVAGPRGAGSGEEGRLSGELVLCKHRPGAAPGDGQVASVSLPLVTTALHLFFSFSVNDLFSGL